MVNVHRRSTVLMKVTRCWRIHEMAACLW